MSFDEIYKIALLMGGVMMFIMSFILWFHPSKSIANRILGFLIFAWGICVLIFNFQSSQIYVRFPNLLGVGTNLTGLFFPLMYLYVRYYIKDFRANYKNVLLHLIPFAVFFAILLPIYTTSLADKTIWVTQKGLATWAFIRIEVCAWGVVATGIFYTVLSFKEIRRFETLSHKDLNEDQRKSLNWIKQFLSINIFLWAVGTSGVLLEMLDANFKVDLFKFYYFGLTLLTLRMSWYAAMNPNFYQLDKTGIKAYESTLIPLPGIVQNGNSSKNYKKYLKEEEKKNAVSREENERDLKKIVDFVEIEKPYLNSNMSLQHISDATELTKHRVSELMNSSLGMSFYDIINEYRVKEVIRLINKGKHEHHKLLHLAELAGFNSKATFNRIFKKTTGKTPSQYIQDLAA